MDETRLRELFRESTDRVVGPDLEIPRVVLRRARRRIGTTVGAALLAMSLVGLGAVAGIRSLVGANPHRPAGPIVPPQQRVEQITVLASGHIVLVSPDGTGSTNQVATGPGEGSLVPVAWSPDGSKLLLHDPRDDTIAVMNADGTGLLPLAGGIDASWSPDGKKILVPSAHGYVYVMSRDGSDYASVSYGKAGSFSPDGSLVTNVVTAGPPDNGIHVAPLLGLWDGRRLDPDGDAFADGQASWAPDGARLAIASQTSAKGWRLYVIQPDGTGLHFLAPGRDPSWSPDGSKIAFAMASNGEGDDIYVINPDGSGLTRLTDDPGPDTKPSWSPGGTKIAFFGARGDRQGIYVMNPDGSDQTWLGAFPSTAPRVVWRVTGG